MTSESTQFDATRKAELLDVYLRKRVDLVRFFTIRLGTAAEAEDLVQEVFLKISAIETQVDIRDPAAYLYRIGSNLLVDRLRMEMRLRRRNREWHDAHRMAISGQAVMDEPSQEDALDAKQRLVQLLAAVDRLSPQCRNVFRLYRFEGKTHGEISAHLGISRSAIEKHISVALKHLVESLK